MHADLSIGRRAVGAREIAREIALVLALLLAPALAADDGPGSTRRHFEVRPIDSEITVDGRLDEAAWESATVIPLLFETRPGENVPAPVETECLITYDRNRLYAAFRAHDPDPSLTRAHLTDRDQIFDDDIVGIILDPFNDERRGFQFFANPRGVQMDLFLDGLSGDESLSWDAIWASAGRIGETGYVVEMAIPFSSLRFPAGGGEQTWGIDAVRWHNRERSRRFASQPVDRNISCHLCQISKITGFAGITPGRNLEITPTVTANRTDQRRDFPTGELDSGSVESEAGLSLRWGITPNLNLNATVNPDFSQVEADAAQLNVNEQFALFFPEKRPFFLEGADFFTTALSVVSTRTVADPEWGVKLSGKQAAHGFGIFAAEDRITNLILPGAEGSDAATLDQKTVDGVVRYRRDLGATSSLGVLFTSREGDDYANNVAGLDAVWRPTDADRIGFQLLGSHTEYPEAFARDHDQPGGGFEDWAGRLSYDRETRNVRLSGSYESVGSDFRSDMGFLPQVDYRRGVARGFYTWIGTEENWYTTIEAGGHFRHTEDQQGNLLERETEVSFEMSGPRQSFFEVNAGQRDRGFRGERFEEVYYNGYGSISPTGNFFASLFLRGGDQLDFANAQLGKVVTVYPQLRYNLGLHLKLNLDHRYQHLDVDGGRLFTANLTEARLTYQFNLRSFARLIAQYRDVERDPALYTFPIDAESQDLFTQLLLSYKLNPQTVFFLGYSDSFIGDESIDLTRRDRTVFLKIGYAWVL